MTLLVLCLHLSVLIDISIKGGYQLIYNIYRVDKHMYRYYSSMPTTADTSLGTPYNDSKYPYAAQPHFISRMVKVQLKYKN